MARQPWPLRQLRSTVKLADEAVNARDVAIRRAFEPTTREQLGYTVDDIAEAAGLSRPRIYQIVKEAEREAM